MLSDKMQKALVEQINRELFSSYLYLSMSIWFQSQNLKGCAKWMSVQSKEEYSHAMKFLDYVQDRGGQAALAAIEAPQKSWKSTVDAFEATLKHEKFITESINALMDQAVKEKDYPSTIFLQWFITAQVEEDNNAVEILEKLKMLANSPGGLFMLDRELGKRESD